MKESLCIFPAELLPGLMAVVVQRFPRETVIDRMEREDRQTREERVL
jgi:hypothetical protein